MAGNRSLGVLTIDLIAKTAGFEQGMDKAARGAEKRTKQIADTATKYGKIAGTALIAGIAAAGGTAIAWTKDVVRLGQEIDRAAKLANSSAQEFQRWAAGADVAGISQEKLADQLKDFVEKVGEFQQTGGGGMKDFFEQIAPKIGITADAFRNLSGPQALQLYYDSLEKANLSQDQMSFYLESMASDTTALIPLLRNGGEGFRKYGDEAERLGAILSNDTIRAIEETRKASARLDQIILGLKVNVAEELLPAFNDFADLLGEQKTQDSMRSIGEFLGSAAREAVNFAGKIAEAGNAYREFLANQGALPAGQLQTEAQLKERIRKLSGMTYGSDLLNQVRRGVFGDAINEQLSEAIAELNGFQWRNVVGGSDTVAPGGGRAGGGRTGTGGGGKGRELPDFASDAAEEARKAVDAVVKARQEFDAWAAQLAGPVAEANYQFAVDMERLNELARKGEVTTGELAEAQAKLREEHEKNITALKAQLTPAEEALAQLKEETTWLLANEDGQRRLAAARMLGADATQEQIDTAVEYMRVNEQLSEAMRNWDEVNRSISDSLFDVVSGASSATDAIKDFFDNLQRQILRNITDGWADQITDMFKGFGSGQGATASGGGGGFWASLAGAVFGGGRANGGWVNPNTLVEINERGVEQANAKASTLLLEATR